MSGLRDRVSAIEVDQWRRRCEEFKRRADDELEFYSIHGFYPENATVPVRREVIVGGWKTTVILENLEDAKH